MSDSKVDRFVARGRHGVTVVRGGGEGQPVLAVRTAGHRRSGVKRVFHGVGKVDLIDTVAGSAKLSKRDAGRAVEHTFEAILDALRDGHDVRIPGFGTFSVSGHGASDGGAANADRVIPMFKAGKALREALQSR